MDTIRKWLYKPKADDNSLLARFYHADRALTAVSSELDSFDGRAEPERCSRLVSRLRQGQDRVLAITNQIMDELLGDDRTPRAFRAKFPEEVLQESLAGQLWFGAECLAAGSSIMNREEESTAMRPLAKAVTKSLDNVRNLLREQCLRNNIPNSPTLNLDLNDAATETLYESLKIFDRLFAEFELSYVSAMVQVKTKQEHEMQELICVLFSESLQRALKTGLLEQEQVDSFDPSLMFSIPRLSIIAGLIIYDKGPLNMDMPSEQMSEMFRPFRILLIRIKDLLRVLNKTELYQLEKLLCTNEEIHLKKNSKYNCDDEEKNSDDDLVSSIVNDCRPQQNKDIVQSFYPPSTVDSTNLNNIDGNIIDEEDEEIAITNEWDKDNKDVLVQPDCATGYLIPNANFGSLFQASDAPLTDSFISSDDEYNSKQTRICPSGQNDVNLANTNNNNNNINNNNNSNNSNRIENRTEIKNQNTSTELRKSLNNLQPGCSKTNSESSDEYEINEKTKTKLYRSETVKTSTVKTTTKHHRTKVNKNSSTSSSSKRRLKNGSPDSSSSWETSSCQSDGDPQEVALAIRAAGRMKFKSTENLLHRLFVCIAGVADQLQTNFASDLRQILRSVFLMNISPPQEEIKIPEKQKDSDMFEFRASENDVIQENSGGSNQSIYSAEEVSPESDSVFENSSSNNINNINNNERSSSLESENRVSYISRNHHNHSDHHFERSRSLGEQPIDNVNSTDSRQYNDNKRSNSIHERPRKISPIRSSNNSTPVNFSPDNSPSNRSSLNRNSESSASHIQQQQQQQQQQQHTCFGRIRRNSAGNNEKPPRWIPDEEAPRCMACATQFTAFRRRHHCRNCGGVFCGVCSNSSAPLPKFGLTKAVRVCRDCYVREVGV